MSYEMLPIAIEIKPARVANSEANRRLRLRWIRKILFVHLAESDMSCASQSSNLREFPPLSSLKSERECLSWYHAMARDVGSTVSSVCSACAPQCSLATVAVAPRPSLKGCVQTLTES